MKIDGANSTPTLREEKTPERYVLHSVWRFCDERQAALIGLAAFTGFRPQVFGSYRGNDGLRIEDLPELEIDNEHKKVTFKVIRTRVIVRAESPVLLCCETPGCAFRKLMARSSRRLKLWMSVSCGSRIWDAVGSLLSSFKARNRGRASGVEPEVWRRERDLNPRGPKGPQALCDRLQA